MPVKHHPSFLQILMHGSIAALMLEQLVGRKLSKREMEFIEFYLMEYIDIEGLMAGSLPGQIPVHPYNTKSMDESGSAPGPRGG